MTAFVLFEVRFDVVLVGSQVPPSRSASKSLSQVPSSPTLKGLITPSRSCWNMMMKRCQASRTSRELLQASISC